MNRPKKPRLTRDTLSLQQSKFKLEMKRKLVPISSLGIQVSQEKVEVQPENLPPPITTEEEPEPIGEVISPTIVITQAVIPGKLYVSLENGRLVALNLDKLSDPVLNQLKEVAYDAMREDSMSDSNPDNITKEEPVQQETKVNTSTGIVRATSSKLGDELVVDSSTKVVFDGEIDFTDWESFAESGPTQVHKKNNQDGVQCNLRQVEQSVKGGPKGERKSTPATPRFGKMNKTKPITIPKRPTWNDQSGVLPMPNNLDEYGDILKTRLGRFHYGLTLGDLPRQFFQGILKNTSGQTSAVMFGDTDLFLKFAGIPKHEVGHFIMDTTFRALSLPGAEKVMTISLLFRNKVIPLWYTVLINPSFELYKRILLEFQQHVLDWPFKSALLNDEAPLCKAVHAVFPGIILYGSWYHYCSSIWNEMCANNIAEQCALCPELMMAVRLLLVVPFLPPSTNTSYSTTMIEGFEAVKEYADNNNLPIEFTKVMDYVASFWFNIVETQNFSLFEEPITLINHLELLNFALLSHLKPNGGIWTLTRSFQTIAKTAATDMDKIITGKSQRSRHTGMKLNSYINTNKKKLLMGALDVTTFLERSCFFSEEVLDTLTHPLRPFTAEETNYVHTEGWRIKLNCVSTIYTQQLPV